MRRRSLAGLFFAVLVAIGIAAAAWAYFTSTGSGTGAATVGTASVTLSGGSLGGGATGYVGDTVTVSGTGFAASSGVTVKYDGTSLTTSPVSPSTSPSGGISGVTFTVPASAAGAHTVLVTGGSFSASATFTITPQITLSGGSISAASGYVGDTVTITGTGFAATSNINTHTYGGSSVTLSPVTPQTSSSGGFTATFSVPASTAGAHTVSVTDASSNTANATFTVNPKILTLSETTGHVGDSVTVTGNGFAASQTTTTLKVNFNGSLIALNSGSTTDATGTLQTASFTVPADPAGSAYTVKITDGTNTTAAFGTNFTITPQISLSGGSISAASGYVGDTVTITGTGFAATSNINTHTYGGSSVTLSPVTPQTSSSGGFTATFSVPASTAGAHTVSVTDASSNTANATFTVNPKILTLSETTGHVGDSVTVTGNGFAASQTTTTLKVNFNGSSIALNSGSTTDATGTLQTASFTVPADPAGSAYTVKITDGTNTTANFGTNFTITPKILTLSETTGHVGDSVTVTGNGFAASQTTTTLKVNFNGSLIALNSGSTTDANGTLQTASFTVPADPAGSAYTVKITDGTNTTAAFGTNFTITPQILTLSETTGHVGDSVTVTGNGFAASQTTTTLKVNFNGSLIALNSGSTTDANGTLQRPASRCPPTRLDRPTRSRSPTARTRPPPSGPTSPSPRRS